MKKQHRVTKQPHKKVQKPVAKRWTVGIDLGDQWSRYCALDEEGEAVEEGWFRTTAGALTKHFVDSEPMRIALEAGTHSLWVSEHLRQFGHEVLVANAREVRAITHSDSKIELATAQITLCDKRIEELGDGVYRETKALRQIPGVGALTALTYILTVADKRRFPHSRDVGCYLGLRPRRSQSGGSDPQLSITKAGDQYLRKLLVQSAHYVLGHYGPASALRQWGQRIYERGGKNAKKRAIIAVARKLSILLHRLWVTQAEYVPFYEIEKQVA